MATPKPYRELTAELAEANRVIRELEEANEGLQERIDQIAGLAVEDDDDEFDPFDENGEGCVNDEDYVRDTDERHG